MNELLHGSTLFGAKVVVSEYLEPKQKLRLSESFNGTENFRFHFNKWLADRFGFEAERFIVSGDTVFVSPRTFEKLKQSPHLQG